MAHSNRRWLAVTVAVLVITVACGGDGTTGTGEANSFSSPTPTQLAEPNVTGTTGSAPIGEPPAAGTYTFLQKGTNHVKDQGQDPETRDATGTLKLDAAQRTDAGLQQASTRLEGQSSRIEQVLLYNERGVFLVSQNNDIPLVNTVRRYTCTPKRPVLILPAGVGPGSTWEDRVDCEAGQIAYEAKVEAQEDVTLGDGTVVPTLRIAAHANVVGKGLNTDQRLTLWWAPSLRLAVKVADETTAQVSVYDVERRAEDVLQSASPAA
jgi:hypothetical protein